MSGVPLVVIGGFLGAGKTTFLNRLLAAAPLKAGLLINDFGAMNVDARLAPESAGRMARLANGCICCSLGDDAGAAIDGLLTLDEPLDAIIVEASGVGDPQAISDIAALDKRLRRGPIFVMADATRIGAQMKDARIGATVRRQIAAADIVSLTKTDFFGVKDRQAACEDARRVIAETHPGVRVVRGHDQAVAILDLALDHRAAPATSDARHERLFQRFRFRTDAVLSRPALEACLAAAPDALLRLKGFCRFDDAATHLVQMVGARWTIEPFCAAGAGSGVDLVGVALCGADLSGFEAALNDACVERRLPPLTRETIAAFFERAATDQ